MNRLPRKPTSLKVCENAPKKNRNTIRSKKAHFSRKTTAAVSLCETRSLGRPLHSSGSATTIVKRSIEIMNVNRIRASSIKHTMQMKAAMNGEG